MFSNKRSPKESPFCGQPQLIVHGAYHKMGTVWLMRVLERVAEHFGLTLQKSNSRSDQLDLQTDILFLNHSHLPLDTLGQFVGSHMIRDPRDVIVSGYFYHLWTEESWVHAPDARYNGQSYQQHLQSLDQHAGLLAEIERYAKYISDWCMLDWNYSDERFFEIRYEALVADESAVFQQLFSHYGFHDQAISVCLELAATQSFERVTKRKAGKVLPNSHLRSGKPGQWREVLAEDHVSAIERSMKPLLVHLGYWDGD